MSYNDNKVEIYGNIHSTRSGSWTLFASDILEGATQWWGEYGTPLDTVIYDPYTNVQGILNFDTQSCTFTFPDTPNIGYIVELSASILNINYTFRIGLFDPNDNLVSL